MYLNAIYISLIAFSCSFNVHGQTAPQKQEKHRIDKQLDDCIDRPDGKSYEGQVRCVTIALEEWQAELTIYYDKLSAKLDAHGKNSLKKDQQEWLKLRSKQFKLMEELYKDKSNSSYQIQYHKMQFIRQRALELKDLYETSESPSNSH